MNKNLREHIKDCFEEIKANPSMTTQEKNFRYGNLMTEIEHWCRIPYVDFGNNCDDPEAFELYKEIGAARDFSIYKDAED